MFCGKAFNSVTKRLFHDSNSKRGGVLMHAKASRRGLQKYTPDSSRCSSRLLSLVLA